MSSKLREEYRYGLDYLEAVTALLQRNRNAHPTAGLFEAADLQWWWRNERATDSVSQLFWFDDFGVPEAAAIATAWNDRIALDPIVLPDATPDWVAHVIERGLAHASELGFETVSLEVARTDDVLGAVLSGHGFTTTDDGVVEAWLATDARPAVTTLHEGYRLTSRLDTPTRPHHMISVKRGHPDPEPRLRQTSLYRPELDLLVLDSDDNVAAYGLFWFDPATGTGLVEPMRTEDVHQQRGLARHILTAGVDVLAGVGANRIKICFEADNPASSRLYPDVGFVPDRHTDLYSGPTPVVKARKSAP